MSSKLEDWSIWRYRTRRGRIKYRVISRSGEHEYNVSRVTEVYVIRAIDLVPFLLESFPLSVQLFDEPIYYPRTLPGTPAAARMGTRRVRWEAFTAGKPVDPFLVDPRPPYGTYEQFLKVTIEYDNEYDKKQPKKGPDPYSYLEIRADAAGQFLSVPTNGKTCYSRSNTTNAVKDKNTDAAARMDMLIPETQWHVTWRGIRRKFFEKILLPNIRTALGKVNSERAKWLYDAAPDTILFTGWSMQEEYSTYSLNPTNADPDEDYEQDPAEPGDEEVVEPDPDLMPEDVDRVSDSITVELKFLERNLTISDTKTIGHNHEWRAATQRWEYVYPDCSNPLYAKTDLNDLFNVDVMVPPEELA